jgi:FkbM family methyltransferase
MQTAQPRVAIDCGANDGGYTRTLLAHGFQVHAFEPVPEMIELIRAQFADNPNVFINPFGLSDKHENIHDVQILEAWALGRPGDGGFYPAASTDPFDLVCMPLDFFFSDTPVGLIKLDVDGFEAKVLRGATQTINLSRPPILCELSTYIDRLGGGAQPFCDLVFNTLNYRMTSMDGAYTAYDWFGVKPFFPYDSSFDVMLLPN